MKEFSIEEKVYDGNYKAYTELINRLEDVKDAIKKQNYDIAMDVLCKPYPEYQIITSTEFEEGEDERMIDTIIYDLERHGGKEDSCYSAEINWLKSLRPQNRWKPSQLPTLKG